MKDPTELPPLFRFGVFEFDPRAGELRKQGMKLKIQGQPLDILALLLERPGRVVTREELQKKLWPADTFVDFDHSLNAAIQRLRAALDDSAETPRYVETLARRGYRFIAPVDGLSSVAARRPVVRWTALAALGLAALAAVLAAWAVGGWRDRLLGPSRAARIHSIAVLPLENLSKEPEQDYFADGMTDALITDLGKISGLRVISRTSVMQYKGTKKPLREIARELGVDAVVEGTVVRSGSRVRVSANLIEAPTDRHFWAEMYERDLRDILALQSEVARAIASEIKVKLTSQEQTRLASARPVNPHAYELYLKGRFYWSKRTDEGLKNSVGYFNQALEEDPTYALAWAGLADTYLNMGGEYRLLPPPEARPRAKAAALKALDLDPDLGEAHASLGLWHFHEWEWTAADNEFKRALELVPNYATAHHWYAMFLNSQGRHDEALLHIRRAQTLDPLSPLVHGAEALILHHARRYNEAIEKADKLTKLYPDFPGAYTLLGLAYVEKGRFQEGLANLEHAADLSHRHPAALSRLGYAYGRAGRRADALRIAGELEKLSKGRYVSPFDRALVYAGLGEREQALAWLEKAYEVRDASISINNRTPWFDSLRSDPRFQDLLRRAGLPP